MSPEFIVTSAEKQMLESAETVKATVRPLVIPFFRALTWALDSAIQTNSSLRAFYPITEQLRQTAWKESNLYGNRS